MGELSRCRGWGYNVLLAGDKTHFGPLYGRIIEGVEIHSPASFAIKLGTLGKL